MIQITTNNESFQIVNGEETFDFAYNSTWIHAEGNSLTIMYLNRKYVSVINGRYDEYKVDGHSYNSLSALETALQTKLFREPGGGGGGGGAEVTYLTYTNGEESIKIDGEDTNYEEVDALIEEGGVIYLTYTNTVGNVSISATPIKDANGNIVFTGVLMIGGQPIIGNVKLGTDDAITDGVFLTEAVTNKVQAISTTFVDTDPTNYPSINAVRNYVLGQGFAKVETVSSLPAEPSTYNLYLTNENKLYKYDGTNWQLLNDKGMTDDEAETVSSALNDLDGRIVTISGTTGTLVTRVDTLENKVIFWTGTEQELPAPEEDGVLYLIHE